MWNGITISFDDRFKMTVVAAWSPSTCRFLHQVRLGCPRTGRSLNNSHVQHLVDLLQAIVSLLGDGLLGQALMDSPLAAI